ncbi:MAG: hypothetical protein HYT94_00550 [Parcubacteria group bacterium]|nr:hypothetical protein [Parcubacteria group bacterium]
MKYRQNMGGFVMLYAILVSTVILVIGLSLLGILIEQIPLSGIERESSLSFYAADSGMECALYGDSDAVTPSLGAFHDAPVGGSCHLHTYDFDVTFPSEGTCVSVTVTKVMKDEDLSAVPPVLEEAVTTNIQSRGYNTVCPPAASAKPWRLERGIKVDY